MAWDFSSVTSFKNEIEKEEQKNGHKSKSAVKENFQEQDDFDFGLD